MKKIISIVLVMLTLVTAVFGVCSCKKEEPIPMVECMACGEYVPENKAVVEELYGEKIAICNDCVDELGGLLG